MKKLLLLLTILMGFGSIIHAEDELISLDFSQKATIDGLPTKASTTTETWTYSNYTFESKGCYKNTSNAYLMMGSNGYLKLPAFEKTVKSIAISVSSGCSTTATMALYKDSYDGTQIGETYKAVQNATHSFNGSYGEPSTAYYLVNNSNKNFQLTKVEITLSDTQQGPQDYEPPFKGATITLEEGQTQQLDLGSSHPTTVIFLCEPDNVVTVGDDGLITAVSAGTASMTALWDADENWNEGEATATVIVTKPLAEPEISFTAATAATVLGEDFTAPEFNNPNNLAVEFSSSNTNVATIDGDGIVTIGGAGTSVIKATFAGNDTYKAGEASYTLTVTKPLPAGAFQEELTATSFGIPTSEQSSYTDFGYTSTDAAGVEYKAHAYGKQEFIQLRSKASDNGSYSGIIISANREGYIAQSIAIAWNEQTANGRILDIYGLHKAYESPDDLYNNSTNVKIGSFTFEGNESVVYEAEFDGEYNFIGIRSNSGALYIDKITITWIPAVTPDKPVAEGFTEGEPVNDGDIITLKAKPGQQLFYYSSTDSNLQPAADVVTEGWTSADASEYSYTVDTTVLPISLHAKAVNGSGTVESEEITLNLYTGTVTGIDNIETSEANDNATEEWFNLQGVRVANPQNGLYIRRNGTKIEKVILK